MTNLTRKNISMMMIIIKSVIKKMKIRIKTIYLYHKQ
jgi:hypothetical protein